MAKLTLPGLQFFKNIQNPMIKRWGEYWKNLLKDYKDVVLDVNKYIKTNKVRSFILFSGFSGLGYCMNKNPDEVSFRNQFHEYSNQLSLVGSPIRNPITTKHFQNIGKNYNEGIIRITSLGIFSLIWRDNYDSKCGLFESQCKYLKPNLETFYNRIIDVGILGRWLVLDYKMQNYDINESD